MPIFVPGNDVNPAAEHKLRSIRETPSWVRLHNMSGPEKEAELLGRGFSFQEAVIGRWKKAIHPCSEEYDAETEQCDEYPYFASLEGGPTGDPADPLTWTGFSLEVIDWQANWDEGQFYKAFKGNCQLHGTHDPFLVVPMPDVMPTRTDLC